jgi:hypothetical protein
MLRILALAAFVAALALLGQSSRILDHAAMAWSEQVISPVAMHAASGGTSEHKTDNCVPHQPHCGHTSGAPAFALGPAGVSFHNNQRSTSGFELSDYSMPSLPLKRDPPIPRPLV